MSNKELLFQAIKNQETSRPGWVPFVGVHGGKLIGKKASEYLQSGELIYNGIKKACELYSPDGIPVVFDLQMEAEVLGCQLKWSDEVPPSVITHPLETGELENLSEFSTTKGRFPEIKKALDLLDQDCSLQNIALFGLITGPFTLAMHLLGNNLFMEMFMNPDRVHKILSLCAEIGKKTSDFYIKNGCEIIGIVDPMTSQISPEHFDEFVTPYVNEIYDFIRNKNALSSMFVCGDATRNLDNLFKTHCDYVSIDENISMEMVKDLAQKNNKSFGGNLKLTSVLLFGNETESKLHTIDTIETGGKKGFILAPGCDLPYVCPEENLVAVSEMVLDEYKYEIAKTTLTLEDNLSDVKVEILDYSNCDKIDIEVVTLDSRSCAPCQYMVEAANKAADSFGEKVFVHEHKISTREGLAIMNKLGVMQVPSLLIDGKVVFSSIIPNQKDLKAKYQEKLDSKK